MLQSFAQFCVALLYLFEQPDVLDSDHRLRGKSLEKATCFSVKGLTSVRRMTIATDRIPSRNNGVAR